MTRKDIFLKMRSILVADFELDEDIITPEAEIYTDLDLDSIDAVDLIIKMKEYIPGKIDPAVFKNAKIIDDVVDILYSLVEERDYSPKE